MKNVTRLGLIIASSIMMMTGQTVASGLAIAEDPQFRATWDAYKAITPEARIHERHYSSFAVSPTRLIPRETQSASFARNIEATSPQEICDAVRSRIVYTPDADDHWQTGVETWNRKTGDCEDFAAAVRDLCLARGLDAQMVIFHAKSSKAAHAVVIGQWNGAVWMSSNGEHRDVRDIAHAREIVSHELQWDENHVAIYRVSGQETPWVETAARF